MSKMTMEREGRILERSILSFGAEKMEWMIVQKTSKLAKAMSEYRMAEIEFANSGKLRRKRDDLLDSMASMQIALNQLSMMVGDFTGQEIAKLEWLEKRLGMEAET